MFKRISSEIYAYLGGLSAFSDVMKRDNKLFLYPMVAPITTPFPFTTYVLGERLPETKDKSQVLITLGFWFSIESYDACCEFTDAITNQIDEDYVLISSSIEYNEESDTFSGVINFNVV